MEHPYTLTIAVEHIFGKQEVSIYLYAGITTLVGPNASGKTQALKAARDELRILLGPNKVRYLSSNRIGTMEMYRSQTSQYNYTGSDDFNFGDQDAKLVRHQIETASGDFFAIDDRKDLYIKVAEQLSVLFDRQIYLRWNAGSLKVYFEKTESEKEYSVTAEASGLVNLVSVLAALYDDEVEVLLIDEPEVSLHPQLQAYLLQEVEYAATKYNKTVIMSTHSTEMISFNSGDDLKSIVFFSESKKTPVQVNPEAPEMANEKLKDFLMRISHDYKAGFYAKRVLLVEGVSDIIICRYLSKKLRLNLDVAGSQIIPIDGKGQFPTTTKLFRLIEKDVSILTDLDGFLDDNNIVDLFTQLPKANDIASEVGQGSLSELIRSNKTKISELCSKYKNDMRDIYEAHPYWTNRDKEADDDKIIKRALIAQLFAHDDICSWAHYEEWKKIKARLEFTINTLGKVGCFILKKGAIENYYLHSAEHSSIGKPSAAVTEIEYLRALDVSIVNKAYADVIKALTHSASTKVVSEHYAIEKELASELALVLAILPNVKDEKEINAIIKQTKGSASSIFGYKICNLGKKIGVEVDLKSTIIDVTGFPFKIFTGDNVNEVVKRIIYIT